MPEIPLCTAFNSVLDHYLEKVLLEPVVTSLNQHLDNSQCKNTSLFVTGHLPVAFLEHLSHLLYNLYSDSDFFPLCTPVDSDLQQNFSSLLADSLHTLLTPSTPLIQFKLSDLTRLFDLLPFKAIIVFHVQSKHLAEPPQFEELSIPVIYVSLSPIKLSTPSFPFIELSSFYTIFDYLFIYYLSLPNTFLPGVGDLKCLLSIRNFRKLQLYFQTLTINSQQYSSSNICFKLNPDNLPNCFLKEIDSDLQSLIRLSIVDNDFNTRFFQCLIQNFGKLRKIAFECGIYLLSLKSISAFNSICVFDLFYSVLLRSKLKKQFSRIPKDEWVVVRDKLITESSKFKGSKLSVKIQEITNTLEDCSSYLIALVTDILDFVEVFQNHPIFELSTSPSLLHELQL
ncbi:hypothetical protein P9112_003172 [Eukaryota sp. TZLM1-RC]